MRDVSRSLAQLLKAWRLQRRLSLSQLAQAAHLSRVYVHHLENGMRQNPSEQVVHRLAQALSLQKHERQQLYTAFTQLTGRPIGAKAGEVPLLFA